MWTMDSVDEMLTRVNEMWSSVDGMLISVDEIKPGGKMQPIMDETEHGALRQPVVVG